MKWKVTIEHCIYQDVEVEARDAYEAELLAAEVPLSEDNIQAGTSTEIIETKCLTRDEACLI